MIHYVLFCILWSKPQTQLISIPVDQYATAFLSQNFGEFRFEASILEERMNSLKIVHIPTEFSTDALSSDLQQRSLYLKMELGDKAASLTCDMREENP